MGERGPPRASPASAAWRRAQRAAGERSQLGPGTGFPSLGAAGCVPALPLRVPAEQGGRAAGTAFALPEAMAFEWLARRAREIVSETVAQEAEPELERLLVAGAVVVREGEHYRIESGEDVWSELEARARRLEGLCECGALLSSRGARAHCRRCGRVYGQA